jgi:hypothetical protein
MVRGGEMTRDEILSMEAGREMDALVARELFGGIKEYWDYGFTVPNYSVSIGAAWEVVEKMHERGYYFCCARNGKGATDASGNLDDSWYVDTGCIIELENQPTLPLAICRAALLAVMEDE